MASVNPRTIGESLYWSYANLAMAFASFAHNKPEYQQADYIVRNKLYYGLLRGKLKLGSFLKDEKLKIALSDACCYCFSELDLSLDHLIPQFKGGKHSADNLVVACRSCNSSKKALDFLEWMAKKGEWPCLWLLRRYLKLAMRYCIENELMDIVLEPTYGARAKDSARIFEGDLMEPTEGASSKQASLFDNLEMKSHLESCEGASRALPFAIALIPYTFPDPVDLKAHYMFEPDDLEGDGHGDAWEGPSSKEEGKL
jgi:HNH endonuclease